MTRLSRSHRTLAIAGVTALGVLGGAPAAHAAASYDLKGACKFPLVGIQPVDVAVQVSDAATPGGGIPIRAAVSSGGQTGDIVRALEAAGIDGSLKLRASLRFRDGTQQALPLPLTFEKWTRPSGAIPDPVEWVASGTVPAFETTQAGDPGLYLDEFAMNLTAYDPNGAPISVRKSVTDIYGLPVVDTDNDPNTFDVTCRIDEGGAPLIVSIPNARPTQPGAVGLGGPAGTTSLALQWGEASDPDGIVVGYNLYRNGVFLRRVETPAAAVTDLAPGTAYRFSVEAIDNNGATGQRSSEFVVSTATLPTVSDLTLKGSCRYPLVGVQPVDFSFDADIPAVWPQDVPTDRVPVNMTAKAGGNTDELFKLLNAWSFGGDVETLASLRSPSGFVQNFTIPLTVDRWTRQGTTVPNPLEWTASGRLPAFVLDEIGTYEMLVDGLSLNLAAFDLGGAPIRVQPIPSDIGGNVYIPSDDDPFTFDVSCKLDAGQSKKLATLSSVSDPSPPEPVNYKYSLAGSTQLKTLSKGTLPLAGDIDADLTVADGTFVADLALKPTQGRLIALGFLPVTAKVAFVSSGKTTGLLDDGKLTTKSLVRIKLPEVKLFGAIPLAGGNNCQTKQLSTINLASTDTFDPLAGGSLAGTFAISDLNGCGVLNGLVSPLTAGGGNAISLKLTAKPGQ